MMKKAGPAHSIQSTGLADVLERVLDKGLVIAGDIKIKLLDIELLTIQIRLMVASVDKAKELGMDWWSGNPEFNSRARNGLHDAEVAALKDRIAQLEAKLLALPVQSTASEAQNDVSNGSPEVIPAPPISAPPT